VAQQLTANQRKLLEGKDFVHLATINRDGTPQVTPVWVETDGDYVIVNTEEKRLKTRNMKRDPRVTIEVLNPENPYTYMSIRGRVVEITAEGGAEGIDRLSTKYLGQDKYPFNQPGDVRVIVRIEPLKISGVA